MAAPAAEPRATEYPLTVYPIRQPAGPCLTRACVDTFNRPMHQIPSASDPFALQAAEMPLQPDRALFNSRELVARVLLRVAE